MARQGNQAQYRTVKQALRKLGLTHQEVADDCGCDRTWITRLAGGERIESLRVPVRICHRLNVPIEALAPRNVV